MNDLAVWSARTQHNELKWRLMKSSGYCRELFSIAVRLSPGNDAYNATLPNGKAFYLDATLLIFVRSLHLEISCCTTDSAQLQQMLRQPRALLKSILNFTVHRCRWSVTYAACIWDHKQKMRYRRVYLH